MVGGFGGGCSDVVFHSKKTITNSHAMSTGFLSYSDIFPIRHKQGKHKQGSAIRHKANTNERKIGISRLPPYLKPTQIVFERFNAQTKRNPLFYQETTPPLHPHTPEFLGTTIGPRPLEKNL
jgi:hypothetical protein